MPREQLERNVKSGGRSAVALAAVALCFSALTDARAWAMPVEPTASVASTARPLRAGKTHRIREGESLSAIASTYAVTVEDLAGWNSIEDPAQIRSGDVLAIAGSDGRLPSPVPSPTRPPPSSRLSARSRTLDVASPMHLTTWVTFYGRPGVPIMGILGEHDLDALVPLLRRQADAYDRLNGEIEVRPAFHLIYGMATKSPGDDDDHLTYLSDEVVERYIARASQEGFGVILDVQIGARTPVAALEPALHWLRFPDVHFALDPEFAVSDGQAVPGQPPGWVNGVQLNAAQRLISERAALDRPGRHTLLIVHQFMPEMIRDRRAVADVETVEVVFTMDGYGPPWTKIQHYNGFVAPGATFTGFKLFYRWDEPLLSPAQTLGIARADGARFIEITPNIVIYQ